MKLPNGFGTVRKLSGKRRKPWAAILPAKYEFDPETLSAKTIRKYLSFHAKKEEAITALVDYNKDPMKYTTRSLTFSDIYEKWSKEKFQTIKKLSIDCYLNGYKYCSPIYDVPFSELRLYHLQKIIDDCQFEHSVQKQIKTLLNQLYKYAMSHDIVDKNYAEFIKIDKLEVKIKRILFTSEEITSIEKASYKNWAAGVALVLIYTGMRKSEILTIKKENIFFEKRYMTGGLKTAAGIGRVIPIHKKIEHVIRDLYDKSDICLLDFIKSKKLEVYINLYFKHLMKDLNIDHTTHDCRNTFISRMHELNAPLLEVKRIVGHASRDITEAIYTKIDVKKLVEVIDILYY